MIDLHVSPFTLSDLASAASCITEHWYHKWQPNIDVTDLSVFTAVLNIDDNYHITVQVQFYCTESGVHEVYLNTIPITYMTNAAKDQVFVFVFFK